MNAAVLPDPAINAASNIISKKSSEIMSARHKTLQHQLTHAYSGHT